MPVSRDELLEEMGLPYVPFTFPTVTVRNNMEAAGVRSSYGEVEILWASYREAVLKNKLRPYGDPKMGGNAPTLNFVAAQTHISKEKVAAFLNGLYKAVTEQGQAGQYLNPGLEYKGPLSVVKDAAKEVGEAAGFLVKPSADALTNTIKYAALALVAGAVIYGIYFGTKVYRGKRKGKG